MTSVDVPSRVGGPATAGDAWIDETPAQLTRAQVQELRTACAGRLALDEVVGVGADGRYARRFAWARTTCGSPN